MGEEVEGIVDIFRTWGMNERNSPELLYFEEEVVKEIKDLIDSQQELIDDNPIQSGHDDFICKLYQMEIDRVNYVLSSYFRIRIKKIEKYALHIFLNSEMGQRLSTNEETFLKGYVTLMSKHFESSFLGSLPEAHQSLTENKEKMIAMPSRDSHVFFRVKEDLPPVPLGDAGDLREWKQDEIVVAPYSSIYNQVADDKVELV